MQLKSKRRLETQRKPPITSSSSLTPSFSPILPTLIPTQPAQTLISPPPSNSNPPNYSYNYSYGSLVEVSSDEEGFRGSWYLATVVKPPLNPPFSLSSRRNQTQNQGQVKEKILVEYKTLLNEDKETLLREFVDTKFVRPTPPFDEEVVCCFEVGQAVDAYYQDGWWCGVVTEVVSPTLRFKVSFFDPPDVMEFGVSDLRLHRDWVDGHWVLPNNQRMSEPSFSAGTTVEVNIGPDNSRDVWYPATVIKQVSNNSFLVEYQSSKEAGFQKVAVDSNNVRPSLPIPSSKTFSLLEKVDAFCDCRWLSGVVTKILSDGRYIVYFKLTKKEEELGHADLRPHMDWVNGKWILSSQDTFMASNSKRRLGRTNGSFKAKLWAASVDSGVTNENVGGRVSAENHKGLEKELRRLGSEKVSTGSATPKSKRTTKHTSTNGDAVSLRSSSRLSEEAPSGALKSPETCNPIVQTEVLNSGVVVEHETSIPNNQGNSDMKLSKDSSQPSDVTDIKRVMKGDSEKRPVSRRRPGRPRKAADSAERMLITSQLETHADTGDQTPITNQLDTHADTGDQTPITNLLDTHADTGDQTLITSQLDTQMSTVDETPITSQLDEHTDIVDQTPASSDLMKPAFGTLVIALTHDVKMIGSTAKRLRHQKVDTIPNADKGKQLAIPEDPRSVESGPQKEGEVTNLKRKRGRPPKVLFSLDSLNTKVSARKPTAAVEPRPISIGDSTPSDSLTEHVRIINDQFKRLGDVRMLSSKRTARRQVRKRKIPTAAPMEPTNTLILKGKKFKSTKQIDCSADGTSADAAENSRGRAVENFENGSGKDVRTLAGTSVTASDDDKPLSFWFEGAQPPPPLSDARVAFAGSANNSYESVERHEDNGTLAIGQKKEKASEKGDNTSTAKGSQEIDVPERQADTHVEASAVVNRDNDELPFVKHSPIWQMIESMDILKRIPQKPHFRPLYNCKEECREGLAIGSMVTFTSLVERISGARCDDSKSLLDGYLEALVDLEELGFNVVPVRDQLNRMISIKSKNEHAQNTCKEIEVQIMEKIQEKTRIENDISELEQKIAELEETQALLVSKRDRENTEIILLQSSVNGVKGALETARGEFEKVASSFR